MAQINYLVMWHGIVDNYRLVICHKAIYIAEEMNEKRIPWPKGTHNLKSFCKLQANLASSTVIKNCFWAHKVYRKQAEYTHQQSSCLWAPGQLNTNCAAAESYLIFWARGVLWGKWCLSHNTTIHSRRTKLFAWTGYICKCLHRSPI